MTKALSWCSFMLFYITSHPFLFSTSTRWVLYWDWQTSWNLKASIWLPQTLYLGAAFCLCAVNASLCPAVEYSYETCINASFSAFSLSRVGQALFFCVWLFLEIYVPTFFFPRTHGNVQKAPKAIRQQIINFIEMHAWMAAFFLPLFCSCSLLSNDSPSFIEETVLFHVDISWWVKKSTIGPGKDSSSFTMLYSSHVVS